MKPILKRIKVKKSRTKKKTESTIDFWKFLANFDIWRNKTFSGRRKFKRSQNSNLHFQLKTKRYVSI
jgi:hypothetical protein